MPIVDSLNNFLPVNEDVSPPPDIPEDYFDGMPSTSVEKAMYPIFVRPNAFFVPYCCQPGL